MLCKDNAHEIFEIAPFVKDLGVNYLQIKPTVYYGREEQEFVNLIALDMDIDKILQYKDENFNIVIKMDEFQEITEGRNYKTCNAVKNVGSIVENGDISICCHLKHNPDFIIGNINLLDFNILWGSIAHQRVIDSIDLNKCPPSCGRWGINKFLEDVINTTMGIKNKEFI